MANFSENESSDCSSEEFQSYWSFAGYNVKSKEPKGICPVCIRPKTVFYCSSCIKSGAFMHSQKKGLQIFADKKLNLCKIKEKKLEILQKYKNAFDKKIKAENLKNNILSCSEKNHLLKECITQTSDKTSKLEKLIKDLKSETQSWIEAKKKFNSKIVSMEINYKNVRTALNQKKQELRDDKDLLKNCVRKKILDLVTDVFYISKVENSNSQENLGESQRTALAEAQLTTYVKDHWEVAGVPATDSLYRIVEASIPGNGDYLAYFTPTSESPEDSDITEDDAGKKECDKRMRYSIEAALTYATHLVMFISYYLNVPVPKQMCFSEFCLNELKQKSFCHKVAKLNANIIYLCLQQNVSPSLLKPKRTIENLLLLLNPDVSDLGRSSPIEPSQCLSDSMENVILKDLMLSEDELESGWVNLCEMIDLESVPEITYSVPDAAQQASQGITAATGDLVRSSVAMLWKVATRQN